MSTGRAWVWGLLLSSGLSVGCGDDCGQWEAIEVDPRLRVFTVQIAAGLGGALGEVSDFEGGGYVARDSGTTQDLLAVFAERSLGGCLFVVAGRAGTIRVSTGEKMPWVAPTVDAVDADLHGVVYSCGGADFGVAVGDGGTIVRGTAWGMAWTPVPSPTTRRLRAVAVGSDEVATAVGEQGTVVRALDAGATWELVSVPTEQDLLSIVFDGVEGYIVGAAGTLLYSPDGLTWQDVTTGVTEDLQQVILHSDEAYAPPKPYVLGETRLYTWSPGQEPPRVVHELGRPLLAVAEYLDLSVLAEGGVMLEYREPYVCELPRD